MEQGKTDRKADLDDQAEDRAAERQYAQLKAAGFMADELGILAVSIDGGDWKPPAPAGNNHDSEAE